MGFEWANDASSGLCLGAESQEHGTKKHYTTRRLATPRYETSDFSDMAEGLTPHS